MITIGASSDYGFTGQYVARLVGRDTKFTFAREFLGRKHGKRNESTSADVDDLGLYEACNVTKRGKSSDFFLVVRVGEELKKLRSDKEDAMKIARAMSEGRAFEDIVATKEEDGKVVYWIRNAREAATAQRGQTLETATEACWKVLEALPEKEAKKVLSALRARLQHPKENAAAASSENKAESAEE